MGVMDSPIRRWYEYHKEDYQAVKDRLAACRNVMLNGRKDCAAKMLEKSCVNAVMSIRTSRARHEKAFTLYYGGLNLQFALESVVYPNKKVDWLQYSLSAVDFIHVVEKLRDDSHMAALDFLQSEFKGLSWVKGSFALAMCGIWELACPDSRTKEVLDIDERISSKKRFMAALEAIDNSLNIDKPLFIKQWALYDYEKQEHADHMPFFTEVLNL